MLVLAQVRRDAHECGLREIFFSSESKVVSFAAGSRSAAFRRLNVWWCVGMVGVCVDHPTQGSTQLLRRDVNQEALRRLMRQPRPLRGPGFDEAFGPNPADEEAEVRAQRQRLQEDAATIAGQIAELDGVLAEFEEVRQEEREWEIRKSRSGERRRQQEAERERAREARATAAAVAVAVAVAEQTQLELRAKEQLRQERGVFFTMALSNRKAQSLFVDRCSNTDMFASVSHVAICEGGFFLSRDDGSSFWSNLPPSLHDRLVREDRHVQGAVQYFAAGSGQAYYAELSDGVAWWDSTGLRNSAGFDRAVSFDASLEGDQRAVKHVCLGDRGSWVVIFENGQSTFCGLPSRLHDLLRSREHEPHLPPVNDVALGPGETWWVRFADGQTDWALPQHVAQICEQVARDGGWVTAVSLCAHASDFFVRSTVSTSDA